MQVVHCTTPLTEACLASLLVMRQMVVVSRLPLVQSCRVFFAEIW